MPERAYMLTALVAEVLGPRNGSHEVLPDTQNPRDEYISGVLEPRDAGRQLDNIEADSNELITQIVNDDDDLESHDDFGISEDDQESAGSIVVPDNFSAALDPRSQPRSIGLTFTLRTTDDHPHVEICATWARYLLHQDGWQRHPDSYLTGVIQADVDVCWNTEKGVDIQLRSRKLAGGSIHVSLYLVNTTKMKRDGRPETDEYLFQPQLRIHCCSGTTLTPVRTSISPAGTSTTVQGSLNAEDKSLTLLYRERIAFARGHMCGATWKEIDPELPHSSLSAPDVAPFSWTDAHTVPEPERSKFSPADVRTELVPCYPIEAPEMNWDEAFGSPPLLDADKLAEVWRPAEIQSKLQPLVTGYENWIARQQSQLTSFPSDDRDIFASHLRHCQETAIRMQEGIDTLFSDEDVRLAFCFANKAIAIQARWANPERGDMIWRPFQLAFILLNIPSLSDPTRTDRGVCDLLWFPTGGGKTEAYLGLAAFTLALRRRRSRIHGLDDNSGAGVGVLSRYTLRLLTIQQFRRALGLITACEVLRVFNLNTPHGLVGWRPPACTNESSFLWGGIRFSAGLWVGGNLTPNSMTTVGPVPTPSGQYITYVGALDILQGARKGYDGPNQVLKKKCQSGYLEMGGDPAQVLNCPCCGAVLAVSEKGFGPGSHTLHLIYSGSETRTPPLTLLCPSGSPFTLDSATITPSSGCRVLSITFTVSGGSNLPDHQIDDWWYNTIAPALGTGATLLATRPARPGYFINTYPNSQGSHHPSEFEIFCPNPGCDLNNKAWAELVPVHREITGAGNRRDEHTSNGVGSNNHSAELPLVSRMQWQVIPEWCRLMAPKWLAHRIPIPAYTVDDQVYHRCPSLVVATVDKFARLAFKPEAASLFGNVDSYHSRWGYYRKGCPPQTDGGLPSQPQDDPPGFARGKPLHIRVPKFQTPDLIIQDELHLIESALGSMVGLYETAIDHLCQNTLGGQITAPKYVASTATVRQAETQVQALFNRRVAQFPPSGISADDRFFARDNETHPLESVRSGRIYVAICAPGKGAQTPIVRIWAALLQRGFERWQLQRGSSTHNVAETDSLYTMVGYFNAIRELAGALSLFRQDIPERLSFQNGDDARKLDRWIELSSRTNSLDLPVLLERLKTSAPGAQDAVFATSMFGTGVDIDRLGLMVVHGQPKTTASYIQATGRVGRQGGGLIVTFYRASRPRDLDHYEFFTGYHRALYRYVEPVTVSPFSPRARERGIGPLAAILLRHATSLQGHAVAADWKIQQRLTNSRFFCQAFRMGAHRNDREVSTIASLMEMRAQSQPEGRRPPVGITSQEANSELDIWAALGKQIPDSNQLVYSESSLLRTPTRQVILGDAHHQAQGLAQAYENAPQSLREVEQTTGFQV